MDVLERLDDMGLNPLQSGVAFLYALETSETVTVFCCFQWVIEKQHRALMGYSL